MHFLLFWAVSYGFQCCFANKTSMLVTLQGSKSENLGFGWLSKGGAFFLLIAFVICRFSPSITFCLLPTNRKG